MEVLYAALAHLQITEEQLFLVILLFVIQFLEMTVVYQPKRFYLIRHGRTLLNEAHVKQGAEGVLSPAGEDQARLVGDYLRTFKIQRVYTSPYERAQQTAAYIAKALRVRVKTSPLLRERKNPTEVIGKSTLDPDVLDASDLIDKRFHEDDFRFSDEENFNDLKLRARTCLSFLERVSKQRICVVTHHAFLKMLLAYMVYGEDLHSGEFVKLSFFNPADNGGVTVCQFYPFRRLLGRPNAWEVLSYNEQIPLTYVIAQPVPESASVSHTA